MQSSCVDTSSCYYVEVIGIDDFNLDEMKVYPNPVIGCEMKVETIMEIKKIKINDVLGNLVLLMEKPTKIVDVSAIKPGAYILIVSTERGNFRRRIVILD